MHSIKTQLTSPKLILNQRQAKTIIYLYIFFMKKKAEAAKINNQNQQIPRLNKKFILNLKGAPSIVGQKDGQIFINPSGNQGLAKGGSGDVLSGIISGIMGRGMDALNAAISGNYIHGLAADNLIESKGMVAMLPSELLDEIPQIFKNV